MESSDCEWTRMLYRESHEWYLWSVEEPRSSAPDAAPELFGCPVRRRYAWQLWAYGRSNRDWRRTLHEAIAREPGVARLSDLLRAAETGTRHYPAAFANAGVTWRDLRARADLAHFPSLPRGVLQSQFHDVFHRDVGAHEVDEGWLGRSSGSTGEPVRFFMDAGSIHFFTAFIRFLWERHRLGALPRAGRSGIVLLCTLPRSAIYEAFLPLFGFTRFRKLHWGEPQAGATLARLAPAVISGDPDSLAALADACEAGLAVRPRLVLSSAFPLAPDLADRIARATGAHVVDYYSMAETGPIAWKCVHGRFHVLEGAVEVESVAGEILVTNLRNPFFPLVRYHTGDLATVAPAEPCECGATTRALRDFAGRVAARFLAADGRRVDPSQLQPVLSKLEVRQFQLEQISAGEIRLRYLADAALDEGAAVPLGGALERLLGCPTRVTFLRASSPIFRSGEKPIVYRGFPER